MNLVRASSQPGTGKDEGASFPGSQALAKTRAPFPGGPGFLVFDAKSINLFGEVSVNVPSPNPPCHCLQSLQMTAFSCLLMLDPVFLSFLLLATS